MTVKEFPLQDLNKRALNAIVKAVGPAGLIRFLQQCEGCSGDYTRDRRRILGHISPQERMRGLRQAQEDILANPALRRKVIRRTA